jgi:magnesium transporter
MLRRFFQFRQNFNTLSFRKAILTAENEICTTLNLHLAWLFVSLTYICGAKNKSLWPKNTKRLFRHQFNTQWTVIRYYVREKRRLVELNEPEAGCWVNLTPPYAPDELEDFARRFEFDPVFLTDSLDLEERARYERDEELRFILINTPVLQREHSSDEAETTLPARSSGKSTRSTVSNEAMYITVPIGIILTIEHIITVSAVETPVLKNFLENRVRNFDPSDEKRFVLQILEQNVYRYLTCLKKLNLQRNRVEKELMHSSRNRELKQLLSIEKSLVYFVNALNANELLKMKMKRTDFLHINGDEDMTELFEDIIIDNSQALSMANVYTNILNGTMDAYSSIISNNLNEVIHRLTIVTVVLMVPTLVASFFGMNIPNGLPNQPWMFYLLIVATIVFTASMYWFLQKRRYF